MFCDGLCCFRLVDSSGRLCLLWTSATSIKFGMHHIIIYMLDGSIRCVIPISMHPNGRITITSC